MRLPTRSRRHGRLNGRVTGGSLVAAAHAAGVASKRVHSHDAITESRVVTADAVVVHVLVGIILVLGRAVVVAPAALMTIIAMLAVVLHVVVDVTILVLPAVTYRAVASVVRPVQTSSVYFSERSIIFLVLVESVVGTLRHMTFGRLNHRLHRRFACQIIIR